MRNLEERFLYIIASSKPWHYEECLKKDLFCNDDFIWVGDKTELDSAILEACNIDYIFFLHWHWLVPESIWGSYECICFHMTDVPYGRGGSPLQNLIMRGHTKTKLTALRMVKEMDAGPVYDQRPLQLEGSAHEIYKRAGNLSYEIIQSLIKNKMQPYPQEGEVVIFQRRKPEESRLPTTGTISDIYDYIRMLDAPTYPPAFIEYGDFTFILTDACIDGNEITANIRIKKAMETK